MYNRTNRTSLSREEEVRLKHLVFVELPRTLMRDEPRLTVQTVQAILGPKSKDVIDQSGLDNHFGSAKKALEKNPYAPDTATVLRALLEYLARPSKAGDHRDLGFWVKAVQRSWVQSVGTESANGSAARRRGDGERGR
jgi:hypothetical protein